MLKPLSFLSILIYAVVLLMPGQVLANSEPAEFTATVESVSEKQVTLSNDESGNFFSVPSDITVSGIHDLEAGDRVTVAAYNNESGETQYVITGFVRYGAMWLLIAIFVFAILVIYGKKGISSLINLFVLLLSILFIMIPLILRGFSPVMVTTIVGTAALSFSIYLSHGINKKSHATIVGILVSLLLIGILSSLALMFASLTGFSSEEASILVGLGYNNLDMRAMLLAAMIIGALGVLDDLIISQISSVQELQKANTSISKKELFDAAMRIGKDHTGAVINTLALAYTGAAFPLMMLLYLQEPPFISLQHTFNNEIVATELVRLLSGTIGIVLSIPVATWLAVHMLYTPEKK